MPDNQKVSTAKLMRNFGPLADKALTEPLTITKNGRLVLLSTEEYARLKRRDREVIRPTSGTMNTGQARKMRGSATILGTYLAAPSPTTANGAQ
jgi:prevent-host-death family protein